MGYVQQQQSQQEQREAAAATTTNSTQINCAHYKRKIVASLSVLTALPDATRNYEMCTCVCVCTFVLLVVVVFADLLLIAPDIFALSFMAAAR